jgi:undecaprenyl pyrophosphate phosphatase UppP
MNVAFFILWLSIGLIFLIRVYFLKKIKDILMNKNIDYNFYSTNIIIGNIPKLSIQISNVQLYRKLYNNLTIVLYVLLFVNIVLLAIEKI